ncbi:MAG: glutamine-hydrolyzing GMP synthase [Desulfurococcales archaeon]|nr:glutamine-hydrolyzing GMP synthase [Desulfurococcales archaeon]
MPQATTDWGTAACTKGLGEIVVLDFGGQYAHLISRRLRELGAAAWHVPVETVGLGPIEELVRKAKAVVLSGGPGSVWKSKHDSIASIVVASGKPVLGICYGHQLLAKYYGAIVDRSPAPEYGPTPVDITSDDPIFEGIPRRIRVWMSHNDAVLEPAPPMEVLATSRGSPVAAFKSVKGIVYGVQWHPEVSHTEYGRKLLDNWLKLSRISRDWSTQRAYECALEEARRGLERVPEGRTVVAAVSGGIDSTVATIVASRAAGNRRIIPVLIDHGLHPEGEIEKAAAIFNSIGVELEVVDAAETFLSALEGVDDPEEKRGIISKLYFEILLGEIRRHNAGGLVQGTIYPDLVETGIVPGADRIKSHHNVAFKHVLERETIIIEPLKYLYKDEVRSIAEMLGLPRDVIQKKPVPGPGLAVRIEGEITREKLELARKANSIVSRIIESSGLSDRLWQYFAIVTRCKATGVKGDRREHGAVIAVRIVESTDAMTANPARLPWKVLEEIASELTRLPGVTRVVYDITSKPPGTIEWE